MEKQREPIGKVVLVIVCYWIISMSMVFLNKFLMSSDETSIPAPLFVTWFQCVVTCIICIICGKLGGKADSKSFFSQFPRATYSLSSAVRVLPLSLVFVAMISCNNLCLRYVEVSFYNVARSLTLVFNVLFSFVFLSQRTSSKTLMTLAVVIFGFIIGTNGELNFSLLGSAFGVLSSMFVSLNSIFTKRVLAVMDNSLWRLTFVNNVNACLLFCPLIFLFEKQAIMDNVHVLYVQSFWIGMVAAGVFGFSIGIVTGLQIKVTSPLSHNISGTAKAGVQSIAAFYIWGNTPTLAGLLGIALVLFGSGLYTYIKISDSQRVQAPPLAHYKAVPLKA